MMRVVRSDFAWQALCGVAGVLCAIFPFLLDHRAYYRDDMEVYAMPTFVAIGRALANFEFPLLTLQSGLGGNLLGEHQFALLNPVSLLLYLIIGQIPDMALGALVMVACYFAILCAGTFRLARSCGSSVEMSVVASVAMVTNNFIYYWLASTWITGLEATAWLIWAMAYLSQTRVGRVQWCLAIVFCYLVISIGYYFTDIVLLLFVLSLVGTRWRIEGAGAAIVPASAFALAFLLAMSSFVPLLTTMAIGARSSSLVNAGFLVPDLQGVLAVSSPFHFGILRNALSDLLKSPIFFAGWYLLPVVPLLDWGKFDFKKPSIVAIGVFTLILLVATQGPSQLGPLRWPFRFLPYFHLCLIILCAVMVSDIGFAPITPSRRVVAFALVGLGAIGSFQAQPAVLAQIIAGTSVVVIGTIFLCSPSRFATRQRLAVFLLPMLLVWGMTRVQIPENWDVRDWHTSVAVDAALDLSAVPRGYEIYLGPMPDQAAPATIAQIPFAQTGLVKGMAEVTGYSPVGHRALADRLCVNPYGIVCPEAGAQLMERDKVTGLTFADLDHIDTIIVAKGAYLDAFRNQLEEGWETAGETDSTVTYRRVGPTVHGIGSVSWTSPGIELEGVGTPHAADETFNIKGRSGHGDRIVLARLTWPGYRAELAGRPVPIESFLGLFVTLDLPDGPELGAVTLHWMPPYFAVTSTGTVLVFVLIVGLCWRRDLLFPVQGVRS